MEKEKIDLENFPTSPSGQKMLSYVSDGFYDTSYVGKWIFQVMGLEYDAALKLVESLPDQFFPEKATWGLMYHEMKWGLPVRENLSPEERRRLIYQKRDKKTPMTPYRMEDYLKNVTDFEVHVCDINDPGEFETDFLHPNVFKVICMGEGTLDSKLMHQVLDRIKQSHTVYILNDRVSIIVDNRLLEKIYLYRISMHMGISFWDCQVLDGSWFLNGEKFLKHRRYDLVLRLLYALALPRIIEIIQNCFFVLAYKLSVEEIIAGFSQGFCMVCDKFSEVIKQAIDLHYMSENKTEKIGMGSVTIRRNLWYLDGTTYLDGTRIMNAMVREESF